ncbi:type II toxin-antitoxin system Phd/YefM family antitoxin [Paenirhodobacter populi]|uniref:Antitoxin n=1 Tax=Paenirhodobacter populi TaxID=2306993 RepID=A0A443K181_9RHOB|nr:type II toxin-antitoxin system Phd/YefM family antitoxin [Sinirhodobacter populi]RWR04661.1 type II toxin-antitoxin system Phd/YefM family antitoxin [Sinirhodobacter populi]RWR26507.1 type II toxin-antitoxin system Phd/YefM family antitoxin [Sinirhodobacter populi]
MSSCRISRSDLKRHPRRAQEAALRGPVVITNRGRPEHVMISAELYHRLAGGSETLVRDLSDMEFDPPRHDPDRANES